MQDEILVPVSLGELIDKYTILLIKNEKITDKVKLENVRKEADLLEHKISSLKLQEIDTHISDLKSVNLELWEIEDEIRIKEKEKDFGDRFVELARSVYVTNDKRFEHKNKINQKYGSSLKEVKSYEDY